MKNDIMSFLPEELSAYMEAFSDAAGVTVERYRAEQIYAYFKKGVTSFSEMTLLPKLLRDELDEYAYLATPKVHTKLVSKIDGTVKYLFELYDGECIESVFMRYEHGNTLCISSQVGCRMGCSFCASTIGGKIRDLTPSEMLGQIIAAEQDTGEQVSNIVMMGIGEPLDNFDNTLKFLEIVRREESLGIGHRHISVSTCGLCDRIRALADKDLQITLSVSLHATTQQTREKLMPVARKFDIAELMDACRMYTEKTNRRISFEYAMILDENDTPADAERLAKLLHGMLSHVNLIPLNAVKERSYEKSSRENIDRFIHILEKNGIPATVRRKLGSDINASCGQLRRAGK